MKYNKLIKNSIAVSEIGFGAWQLGKSTDWKSMTDNEAIELVHKALDLGINFFDTAPNYGLGTSEERLGKALCNYDRSKIVINTKFGHSEKGELNFSSDIIKQSLDGSLKRLKTDYVDSLIIHNPPYEYLDGNKNDHYEILEKLKEEGKIRAYGASLDTYKEMKTFITTTNCEVIEAFYNIIHQDAAKAFNLTKEKNIGIIVKIPLDSGWLSGKYNEQSSFDDIRNRWSKEDIIIRAGLVNQIKKLIPGDYDLAQTAISFCLANNAVSTVIPGIKNNDQLLKNIESANKAISNELVYKLEKFYQEEIEKLNLPW